jgi:hypothetical protein
MKEKDSQAAGGHRMVLYVEKEDSSYGPLQTGSYMVSTYMDDLLEKRRHLVEGLRRRLAAGEISPVAYYLTLIDIAEADLALRVGISRRKLRRHLTPEGFADIDIALAMKYAEVFAIPVANLFQVLDAGEGRIEFAQERTANPLVTVTRARERAK